MNNKLANQILDSNVKFKQFNISYKNLNNKIPRSLRSMPENSFCSLNASILCDNVQFKNGFTSLLMQFKVSNILFVCML